MNPKYDGLVIKEIKAKTKAETERLTILAYEKAKIERDVNLTAEIHKIVSKRKLKGDKIVFKTDEEFKEAGMEILKEYHASDSEKTWFLGLV